VHLRNVLLLSYYFLALLRRHQRKAIGTVAITLSNRGAITALRMMPVRNIAAAAAISTVMVPPTVTQSKHPNRHHSRRRPASGDGSGTGITGFAPASERKRRTNAASRRAGQLKMLALTFSVGPLS
jgi:hypothetical protein